MKTGIMTLPSKIAVALWKVELKGQLSDGIFENSEPYDHWEFWHGVRVVFGESPKCEKISGLCLKNTYDFTELIDIIPERLISICRMVKAGATTGCEISTGDYMPPTLKEFHKRKNTYEDCDFNYCDRRLKLIPDQLAIAYYNVRCSKSDLKKELKLIEKTMKLMDIDEVKIVDRFV
jgi:hypothetical protein